MHDQNSWMSAAETDELKISSAVNDDEAANTKQRVVAVAADISAAEAVAVGRPAIFGPARGPSSAGTQAKQQAKQRVAAAEWRKSAIGVVLALVCATLISDQRRLRRPQPCFSAETFQPLVSYDADALWQEWKEQVAPANYFEQPKPAVWVLTCRSQAQCSQSLRYIHATSTCNFMLNGSEPVSADGLLDGIIGHAKRCPEGSVVVSFPDALAPETIASILIPATGEKGGLGSHGGAVAVSTMRILWLYVYRTDSVADDFAMESDYLAQIQLDLNVTVRHRARDAGWSSGDSQHVAGSFARRINKALPLKPL